MCGEHTVKPRTWPTTPGSSPHVRGALEDAWRGRDGHGIIPACAGSTACCIRCRRVLWDHPRMCGEHGFHGVEHLQASGSSPHVRGARFIPLGLRGGSGIIPACAGSTPPVWRRPLRPRDHPRMCGEHSAAVTSALNVQGSSPHVRGALRIMDKPGIPPGIIPACAGSTILVAWFIDEVGDHPRMCGEHLSVELRVFFLLGSSPHVRGAPNSSATTNRS